MKSVNFKSTNKSFTPKISDKDGNIGTTPLANELLLKMGAKVMIVHNIDTLDQLSNGQRGILVDVIKTEDKKIEILIIKLNDQEAGKLNMW